MTLFHPEYFNMFLITMAAIAVIVFVALHYVEAGYGIMYSRQWGSSVPNRTGWVLMEAPVFVVMAVLWILSGRRSEAAPVVMFLQIGRASCRERVLPMV